MVGLSGVFILVPSLLPLPNLQAKCTDCQKVELWKHTPLILNFYWNVLANQENTRAVLGSRPVTIQRWAVLKTFCLILYSSVFYDKI